MTRTEAKSGRGRTTGPLTTGIESCCHVVLLSRRLTRLQNYSNCPEVGAEVGIRQVGKGDGEVAAHAPACSPTIPANEPASLDIVADGFDGVTTEDVLARGRHRNMAGAGYRVSFEAFVNSEAKDERITRSQAALHLGERLTQSLIAHGGMLRPFRVAGSGRFRSEERRVGK